VIEGTGSYGAGAAGYLVTKNELVVEFDHPSPRGRDGAKTDELDALRAARQVLGRARPSVPRARGDREALRVLEVTRRGAQTARVAAINELKALVVTAPIDLRDQLRDLNTAALVTKCRAFRLTSATINEHTATKAAMRSVARRIKTLTTEITELTTPIAELTNSLAPQLMNQPGIGPITAAQIYIAWSHPHRCRNEAAFARLAGVAPLEASSGQHTRHRLNPRGDRTLNQALHTITITRTWICPKTRAYIAKRISQGCSPVCMVLHPGSHIRGSIFSPKEITALLEWLAALSRNQNSPNRVIQRVVTPDLQSGHVRMEGCGRSPPFAIGMPSLGWVSEPMSSSATATAMRC
jgi:transposase